MKLTILLLALVLCMALTLAACSDSLTTDVTTTPPPDTALGSDPSLDTIHNPTPETPIDSDTNINELPSESEQLVVSDEMVVDFCRYYMNNSNELRMLPRFTNGDDCDWDELTFFVFTMSKIEPNDDGNYILTDEVFDSAVKQYFHNLDYSHKGSTYLNYDDGFYTPKGFDNNGGTYYRLTSLSRNDDVYTAAFDGFELRESDYFFDINSVGENMKVLLNTAGVEIFDDIQAIRETILDIFIRDDYDELLSFDEHVEITYKLSDDAAHSYIYLSCKRTLSK